MTARAIASTGRSTRGVPTAAVVASVGMHAVVVGTLFALGWGSLPGRPEARKETAAFTVRFQPAEPIWLPPPPPDPVPHPSDETESAQPRESTVAVKSLRSDRQAPELDLARTHWNAPSAKRRESAKPLGSPPIRTPGPVRPTFAPATAESTFREARAISRNTPLEYPARCRKLGHEGEVKLRLQIDRTGRVTSAAILEEAGCERLNRSARRTALALRYEPATQDGMPVASELDLTLRYRLK